MIRCSFRSTHYFNPKFDDIETIGTQVANYLQREHEIEFTDFFKYGIVISKLRTHKLSDAHFDLHIISIQNLKILRLLERKSLIICKGNTKLNLQISLNMEL